VVIFHRPIGPVLIIAIFLLGIVVFPVQGGGSQEDPIDEAAKLVEERKYNDAILILSEVVQTDPRRLDEVEALMENIRKAREIYNSKYAELIDLYNQEELDLDRAYEIFKELEEMDKSPNKATVESFEKAKATAVFLYNERRFQQIMSKALVQLNEGSYWEAVETYLTGFDIYLDEYQQKDYGNIITEAVSQAKDSIVSNTERFKEIKNAFLESIDRETALIDRGDLGGIADLEQDGSEALLLLSSFQQAIFKARLTLERQNQLIQKAREEEEFHLSFLELLINGRRTSEEREGILGAMGILWESSATEIARVLDQQYQNSLAGAKSDLSAGRWDEAQNALVKAGEYADLGLKRVNLWSTQLFAEGDLGITEEGMDMVKRKAPDFYAYNARVKYTKSYENLVFSLRETRELTASLPEEESIETILEQREAIQENTLVLSQALEEWRSIQVEYQTISGEDLTPAEALRISSTMISELEAYVQEGVSGEVQSVARIATISYSPLYSEFEEERARVSQSTEFIQGVERPLSEEEDAEVVLEKYPIRGKELLLSSRDNLQELSGEVQGVITTLEEEPESIRKTEKISSKINEGEQLYSSIQDLLDGVPELVAEADELIFMANRYREEGYLRLREAEQALDRADFDLAREKLSDAGENFVTSLNYREDPEFREESDERTRTLSRSITETENQLVIAEVRQLINQGRQYYSQGDFRRAENSLVQAQSRWKTTNVEPNEEVEYWLRLTRTALSVRTGREIAETDPLYPEMRQFLNLARQDFLIGKELIEEGNRRDALERFESAEEKLLYVLIPFPINQEASVLSLRIEQYRDRDNFNTLFRNKFENAKAKMSSQPREAYIELKDLQQIEPNFPGLSQAIYDVEIALGIRVPPPDPAKKREAERLYNQAFEIVQSNVRSQFPIALEYLNEAFKLDPQNEDIIRLKDRLQSDSGGTARVVLSSEAQRQYRLAEEKYIAQSYYEALRIVNRLLQDEENRQFSPLLELKRRIESRI